MIDIMKTQGFFEGFIYKSQNIRAHGSFIGHARESQPDEIS